MKDSQDGNPSFETVSTASTSGGVVGGGGGEIMVGGRGLYSDAKNDPYCGQRLRDSAMVLLPTLVSSLKNR